MNENKSLYEAAKAAADLLQSVVDAEEKGDVYDFFHHRDLGERHFEILQALHTTLKTYKEDYDHDMKQSYEVGIEEGRRLEREVCVRYVRLWNDWSDELADALEAWNGK